MFEANDYAGGHTNTVRVDTEHETHHVDTGFIVHNDRNYPYFLRLLHDLGVDTQPSEMSFSVSDGRGGVEYNGASANGLFANRANLVSPSFHRMVRDLLRFNREAPALVGPERERPEPRASSSHEGGYSPRFVDHLIVPQASAVWSADPESMWDFPASMLAEFFDESRHVRPQRPAELAHGGGRLAALRRAPARAASATRCGSRTPVRRIRRLEHGVEITPAGGEPELFDEVILATHSDQALAMLGDATPASARCSGRSPTSETTWCFTPTASLLPRRRRAWASWNYHLQDEPVGRTTVTYHMNRLQALSADREFCVTLNRDGAVDPELVIRPHPLRPPGLHRGRPGRPATRGRR